MSSLPPDHEPSDEELEMLFAFSREVSRIILPALRASGHDEMHGVALPTTDPKGALERLRQLPDGASLEDLARAMDAPPPEESGPEKL